jgi:O-acetyl-ADP-ribose deacetylase
MNQSIKYRGCSYCKHFRIDGSCHAFDPDPIPIDIVSGQTKHTIPILG